MDRRRAGYWPNDDHRADAHRADAHRADAHRADAHRAGDHRAGDHRTAGHRRASSGVSRAALNEFLTRPVPVSLSQEEIGPAPVVTVPDGDTVDVWLRFVEVRVQERAVVVAYTDRAVQVEVRRRDGSRYRVWVWNGAVTTPGRER